jgi:hypothetical protein
LIKKLNLLSLSFVLTVSVFIATTAVQRVFVAYEPTVKVLVAAQDIQVNRPVNKFMFKQVNVPLNVVMNFKVLKNFDDISGQYSTEYIHNGEILRDEAIALKNEVKIIEIEPGREKVSVKLKAPENAVSYQIKTGDKVNLYFTGRNRLVKSLCSNKETSSPAALDIRDESYSTVKLLDTTSILGIFDETGNSLSDIQRNAKIDTVVFSVNHQDSILISNLKDQGTFDITGLPY